MRSAHLTPLKVASAVLTAACAFSLTACDGKNGATAASSSDGTNASASPSGAAASRGSDTAQQSAQGKKTTGASGSAAHSAAGGSDTKGSGDACTLNTSRIRLQDTGGTAPVALLTLTNTGSRQCAVYGAPIVSDPAAGRNLPVNKNTVPQSVVELAPGHTAYAAIALSTNASHRAKTLNVTLTTKDGGGTDGHVTVASPGSAGLGLDDQSQVTYWQTSQELAEQSKADALSSKPSEQVENAVDGLISLGRAGGPAGSRSELPSDRVDHLAMVAPPTAPLRRPVGQQRLNPPPLGA
ncbi:DUF4232 domain-containing protein [Streptomyces sp. NPDC054933]